MYFGAAEDLLPEGKSYHLNLVSMSEKFNAYEQLIAFFYNSDSECRKSHGLQEDKEYLAFFNGEDLPPKYLEVPDDGIPE